MMPELQTPFNRDFLVHDEATRLEYEVFHGIGEPKVMFVTGLHGHEFNVIGVVRTALNRRIVTGELQYSHVRVFHAHPEDLFLRFRDITAET